jgi:hypothetical protein
MSSNGVDLGHIAVMLENVITAQERMRVDMETGFRDVRAEMHAGLNEVRGGLNEVRGAVNMLDRRVNDLSGEVKTLRQTVIEYHSSVLGHGILISDLDARLRRVEQHLDLSHTA